MPTHDDLLGSAECVFEGVLWDVYQWEQELFDGSFSTFETIARRMGTVDIIVVDGDRIGITYQEQPKKGKFYSLYGGRLEPGESPEEGARRELLEESGYEA